MLAPAQGGQLQGKGVDVENYPGLFTPSAILQQQGGQGGESETSGRAIVEAMRAQAHSFGARFVDASVVDIKEQAKQPATEGQPAAEGGTGRLVLTLTLGQPDVLEPPAGAGPAAGKKTKATVTLLARAVVVATGANSRW